MEIYGFNLWVIVGIVAAKLSILTWRIWLQRRRRLQHRQNWTTRHEREARVRSKLDRIDL